MFYSLLLFIFALIMHILFTLCKIGDGGGRWNRLRKIKRDEHSKPKEMPIKNGKAKKPQLIMTKLLSTVPLCPAASHQPGRTEQLHTTSVTSTGHRWQELGELRDGDPACNQLQSECGKERHKSLQRPDFCFVGVLLLNTLLYTT